jgi:hypothetical protein
MDNIKPISRFASLKEDLSVNDNKKNNNVKNQNYGEPSKLKADKPIEKNGSFKNDIVNNTISNKDKFYERNKFYDKDNTFREKEYLKNIHDNLDIEKFPELTTNNVVVSEKKETMNFLDKLKCSNKILDDSTIDKDLINLKPGWVLYKKDTHTNRIIIKSHDEIKETSSEDENENINNTFNKLVELYEYRTNQYIEQNGFDNWEKTFKFHDWKERAIEEEDTEEEIIIDSEEQEDGDELV